MEPVSQRNLMLEYQICLNCYNLQYRPKLLDCQHTCCSVCLTQMKLSLSELRCPWCRSVTTLPPGVSVSQMTPTLWPSSLSHPPPEYTPVFFKQLLSNTCYLSIDHQERATVSGEHSGRHLQAGQTKEMSPVPVSDEGSPGLGEEHGESEQGCCKSSFTTRAGLVVLLGVALPHGVSCSSQDLVTCSSDLVECTRSTRCCVQAAWGCITDKRLTTIHLTEELFNNYKGL
uniref:RING-type E3 ubiquitin transferase n=1 Tax=Oncorhynchus tshawytscha TaxID=74940 RepID=A0A8C8GII0_ONCTS